MILGFAFTSLVRAQDVGVVGETARPPSGTYFDTLESPGFSPAFPLPSAQLAHRLPEVTEGGPAEPRNRALELVPRDDAQAVRRYKRGFFQRMQLSGEWLVPVGDRSLEIRSLDASLSVAIPLGSFENLLMVTPNFRVDHLTAEDGIEIPSSLYGTGIDFMWRSAFNDRWGAMVGVQPAMFSDFHTSRDALRITGRAFATWQWVPERLTLLMGIVYLDRNDIRLLPGAGMIWTPSAVSRIDLVFPRPKIAHRLAFLPQQSEDWVYLRGSLGGSTWAVRRASGVDDQLTLRDYRIYLGWERIREGGGGLFAEAGYVFGRRLEYEVVPAEREFSDALTLGLGITF